MDHQHALTKIVMQAITAHSMFAKELSGRYRKHSGIPYCAHIVEVMKRVAHYGYDFEHSKYFKGGERYVLTMLAAAVGHDLKEDTCFDLKFLTGDTIGTPQRVLEIIDECTRPEGDDATREEKWQFLRSFYNKSLESVVIKIADRYCNVMDYLDRDPKYAAKYALQAYPLYRRFVQSYQHLPIKIAERIDKDVTRLMELVRSVYEDCSLVDSDELEERAHQLVV